MAEKDTSKKSDTRSVMVKNNLTISLSAWAVAMQTIIFQRLHFQTWAVWSFPAVYVFAVALTMALVVKFIKAKIAALAVIYALIMVFEISLCGNAVRCVKDITGGTQQIETRYYWLEGKDVDLGNEIRIVLEDGEYLHLGYPKKQDYSQYEVFCAEDELDLRGIVTTHGRMYMAKISYYPNNRTVKDISFEKRQGLTEWVYSPDNIEGKD